jgi:hypothetical protein
MPDERSAIDRLTLVIEETITDMRRLSRGRKADRSVDRRGRIAQSAAWGLVLVMHLVPACTCRAGFQAQESQELLIDRPGPPPRDDLESDENHDGVPDGWYNARDAHWMTEGGASGPHFVRIECSKAGRPARLSRAFGIDGSKTEAIILGLWVRASNVQLGEREGSEPSLLIDFLGDQMRQVGRGLMGPWTHSVHDQWTRVAKRIPVPPGTKDAIMTVGLLGATGTLDVDGLTVELSRRGGTPTTNLIVNGDFELGDPAPANWMATRDARRVFPGFRSAAAIELERARSGLQTGLAIPVEAFDALDVSMAVRCSALRGAGGAGAAMIFYDNAGNPLQNPREVTPFLRWSSSIAWHIEEARVSVPAGAVRAVLQIEKFDSVGSVRIDEIHVVASPNPDAGSWTPYHTENDTDDWLAVPPSSSILPKSALDFSFLLDPPAGRKGAVTVKDGRLAFENGGRARFFGVELLPPAAFQPQERADELADRLARSGVNLVRLGSLDMALGPNRSLFDDTRDDTSQFDPEALARLDHLLAALKRRGIYVAIELVANRRFRAQDGIAQAGLLPAGGGPAALFDPTIGKLELEAARSLLSRENSQTNLALIEEPSLAWITLFGEVSLFDLIENPDALPPHYARALRALAEQSTVAAGRRFWQALEQARFRQSAEVLRNDRLKAPIAGISHWRRDSEFCAGLVGQGLDLIEDRLFWTPSPWAPPEARSLLLATDGGLAAAASSKRRPDRPYVVGQWCNATHGAWSYPHEAADQLLGVYIASSGDWDALVRRGVFVYPLNWGEGPAGTTGGEDIYQVAQVANGSPHIFALWPHAASIMLRGHAATLEGDQARQKTQTAPRASSKGRRRSLEGSGWDPARGRLVIDTAYTQGVAGWISDQHASFSHLEFACESPFAVLVASSAEREPIATSRRLLVSALARVEPTGFRWVDSWKRLPADPGGPPFLQEPVKATITWRHSHKGNVRAYVLDNTGNRTDEVKLEPLGDRQGHALVLDGKTAAFHWELLAE